MNNDPKQRQQTTPQEAEVTTRPGVEELGAALVEMGYITASDLSKALRIHRQSGERFGRILMAFGYISRQDLYEGLAELWGYPFVRLRSYSIDPNIAYQMDPEDMAHERFVPIGTEDSTVIVATARRPTETLTRKVQAVFGPRDVAYYVTSEWDIDYAITLLFRDELIDRAVFGLYYRDPAESAYTVLTEWQFVVLVLLVIGSIVALYLAPTPTILVLNLVVNLLFLLSILFKFSVSLVGGWYEWMNPVSDDEVDALDDADLPTYTILVPLYDEADVVGHLIDNLTELDYPTEKLQVLLLLEENDKETIEVARLADPPEHFSFVKIPEAVPQTKPKACNVGLYFAEGERVVIYDAEDWPQPDQLKKAVVVFEKGPDNLACAQAALNYYNIFENFLTRMFTLEYSYWFDYMLPGLDRFHLPIPLGGTSNHFRTAMLRELGGWDPFNVTEDADLGIRAAANGYTVQTFNSTTFEEANSQLGNWIRQRSRWIKGYMQTTLVHLRRPFDLVREIGLPKTAGFLMLVGGTPVTFLMQPILWGVFAIWLISYLLMGGSPLDRFFPPIIFFIAILNLVLGNAIMILLNMIGVFRRRLHRLMLWAVLNPVYWILHSVAAYRALWQLVANPFYWEKTTHGISSQMESFYKQHR